MEIDKLEKMIEHDEISDMLQNMLITYGLFLFLFHQPNLSEGAICTILAALAKVSTCKTDNQRILLGRLFIQILPERIDSVHFLTTKVRSFVVQLCYLRENLLGRYLKGTHNLLILIRNLQLTVPTASMEIIHLIIPLLQSQFDYLNKKQNCIDGEDVALLNEIINGMAATNLPKVDNNPNTMLDGIEKFKPPKDFRKINICPTFDDIFTNRDPFFQSNIVNGKYICGVDHYLDV